MEFEILEIIKKNLPAQVGEVLKTRLEQAERDANTVKNQSEQITNKTATIVGLEKTIADYKQFDNRNSTLEAREKAVEQQERDLKIKTLEFQLTSEREKTEFSKAVALGLVRNTEYRKQIFDSESQSPYIDSKGTWIYPTPISKNLTETKTKE